METTDVTDLYLASYLLLSGCALVDVACEDSGGKTLQCSLRFSGQHIEGLKELWFTKRAMVNLWAFRQAYAQIQSSLRDAKRLYARSTSPTGIGGAL